MLARRKHTKRTKNLAFKIWRREGKNLTKTSRILRDEHSIKVEPPTLMKWRDADLWEAKSALIENQVQKLMRSSDDPVLQEMAMDDSMFLRFLGVMARLVEESIGRRAASRRFLPRNTGELMKMMEFIGSHQERILTRRMAEAQNPDAPRAVTFNDNRKIILKGQLAALPKNERNGLIREMRGAVDQKQLAAVRQSAFEDDDESASG